MKVSKKVIEIVNALPEEVKRQIVESYQGVLQQQVYHIPTEKIESVWAMDLCRAEDYITTSVIDHVAKQEMRSGRQ